MRQKLQLIAQTMLLVFLPAFVMRPVMVTVESGLSLPAAPSVQKSISFSRGNFIGSQTAFRSVCRETSPSPDVLHSFTKTIRTASAGRVLVFVSNAVRSTPQSFLVLRI